MLKTFKSKVKEKEEVLCLAFLFAFAYLLWTGTAGEVMGWALKGLHLVK